MRELSKINVISLLFIIGFIVFSNMLFNSFVWDDKIYITQNPEMYSFNLFKLLGHNIFNSIGQYRPLPAVYFGILYSVFKENPFFFHIPQLLLHVTNTYLVFKLFEKFFGKLSSLFASLFFLIHPIQVESVSFIAATISPMFFFFGILALLISMEKNVKPEQIIIIFCLLFLSLLTKETGLLFLLMILGYKIIFSRKLLPSFTIFSFLTVCVYYGFRLMVGNVHFFRLLLVPISRLSLPERLTHIPIILVYYLRVVFFPLSLAHNQLWIISKITLADFYFPLMVVILFFSLCTYYGFTIYRKSKDVFKTYLFFGLWFLLGLVFHLQIIPLDQTVADRWFYFPLVGLIGMMVAITSIHKPFIIKYKTLLLIVISTLLTLFSLRTILRNADWADGITLYTHDMKIHNNFDIETNLAAEYFELGNYALAKNHFNNSIALFPHEGNYANLAYTYVKLGNLAKAEEYYSRALQQKDYAETSHKHELRDYVSYSQLLLQLHEPDKAITTVKTGLQDYPDSLDLWIFLATAEHIKNNKEQALIDTAKAMTIDPTNQTAQLLYEQIQYDKPIQIAPLK